jgi:hypothetical protein
MHERTDSEDREQQVQREDEFDHPPRLPMHASTRSARTPR